METWSDLLSTSPGVAFPLPAFLRAIAEQESKDPARRPVGDERAALSSLLGWQIVSAGDSSDDGDDELRDAHSDGTHKEQTTSSHLLNQVETRNGRNDVDDIGDDLDGEATTFKTCVLEVLRAVVEL